MKIYILTLPKKQLEHATDMLRYDDAFRIEDRGDEVQIEMLSFTPARWESFGVKPPSPIELNILKAEYDKYIQQAVGFTAGIRFAQKWGGQVVQS